MSQRGRNSKYTEEIVSKIIELIEEGYGQIDSAKQAGISPATLFQWKLDHPDFSEAIKRAEQVAKTIHTDLALKAIYRALDGNQWQAAAWFLERTSPEEYAKKETPPPAPPPITINVERVSAKRKEADNEAD